jgi:hypothetical protein
MKRREFMTLLGGAVACPLVARAQQAERVRSVGVLFAAAADDPEYQARLVAFRQSLQQLGWVEGRNVLVDTRWATQSDHLRRYAAELARYRHNNHCAIAAGDPHRADRVRLGHRPGRRRFRREPGTTGGQRHRVHNV